MFRRARWWGGAGTALLAMLAATTAQAGDQARDWIARMNDTLVKHNFEGVVSYQTGERRVIFRIVHRMRDGRIAERVVSTDGSGREWVRNGSEWVAYYPDRRAAETQTRNRSAGFLPTLNGLNEESGKYYDIIDAGPQKLIGRTVQLIRIEPRDALRYGYRLWLDSKTAMPLKSQRVSRAGQVIEEIAFISPPSLPETVPDESLKPEVDPTGFSWKNRDVPLYNPAVKRALAPRGDLLPAGFRVRIFINPPPGEKPPGPRTRFIVSDSIGWVSVYVDVDKPPVETPASGRLMMMGPTAIYSSQVEGYRVVVMGEVPPHTIKAIAEAVRPE